MNKRITLLVIAIPLLLAGCSGSPAYEGTPEEQAAAACSDAVAEYATDPVIAEIVTPVTARIEEAKSAYLPEGTVYRSVNFGDVRFITGTGAPDFYSYGCITYHDQDEQLIDAKADVVNSDEVESFGYTYKCDKFYYEKQDLDKIDNC